jgi:hypothetical protein
MQIKLGAYQKKFRPIPWNQISTVWRGEKPSNDKTAKKKSKALDRCAILYAYVAQEHAVKDKFHRSMHGRTFHAWKAYTMHAMVD